MNDYPKVSEGILGDETIEKTNTQLFLELVGQCFPEAIKDGEVDFTALKEEMGEFPQISSEHYDFTWAGKQSAKKEAMADLFGKTLRYKSQDSLNSDTTENIYIEGDNLEALKLLRRNYHGKIKMIYIDPPYNTGNDFVYHDNFTMTDEELAEASGNVVDGVRYQKNNKDSSRYHTNWLNMMYPRLKLARELLSDDGVIFISIDENELENAKKICNEVFGESNLVGTFIWRKKDGGGQAKEAFVIEHEYILVYHKSENFIWIDKVELRSKDEYNKTDVKGNFKITKLAKWGNTARREDRPSMYFPITAPDGTECYPIAPDGGDGRWRVGVPRMNELIANDLIHWEKKLNGWIPYEKEYFANQSKTIKERSILYNLANTGDGSNVLTNLFGKKDTFENPKPVELIKLFLQCSINSESIVLDFFSGSATTAHAVMQLNAEDGGNRKFIMVQLPEETAEKSEAYKAGYKNICEIGKERIRRAAKKIHEDNPEAKFDDGFKVFEVADTNIRWNTIDDEEIKQLGEVNYNTDGKDRIDFTKDYTDIDVVYEIMLRQFDIPLSTPIEKLTEVSDRTYIFADAVVVCLEPEIDNNLIEKLASIEPTPAKFVLRDSAFNDDIELKDVSFRRLSALIANHQTEEERKSKYNNYIVEFI